MKNPAAVLPGAWQAVAALNKASDSGGVPADTMEIVHLRVSQINGCSACVASAANSKQSAERLVTVAAWREAPYFTDAERAALALTEAATRIADRGDPVDDPTWAEAARHYDERSLGALVVNIGLINLWNRLNVTTRQVAAHRATCQKQSVGVAIARDGRVVVTGYNGAPAGMPHCEHHCTCDTGIGLHEPMVNRANHDSCCDWNIPCTNAVHAEANAIAYAARWGIPVEGGTLFTTFSPCLACGQLIVNAGLTRVVFLKRHRDERGLVLLCRRRGAHPGAASAAGDAAADERGFG